LVTARPFVRPSVRSFVPVLVNEKELLSAHPPACMYVRACLFALLSSLAFGGVVCRWRYGQSREVQKSLACGWCQENVRRVQYEGWSCMHVCTR